MHFESDAFRDSLQALVASADRGAADLGEVIATAARIPDGDADSWVLEWIATAGTAWAAANAAGDRGTALAHLRRAAAYYAAALDQIAHSAEEDRRLDVWRRQRECWDRAVELLPVPGERLAIPFAGTTLPAYFFAARPGTRRPLVIMNNGSTGLTSRMWQLGGAAAAERGYHWMTFEGPGQGAALVEQGLRARPDWEAVLTPVVDAMLARSDVDPDRIAVVGVEEGGFWVPRALGFERRLAAAVADPGVVDVSAAWTAPPSRRLLDVLRSGDRATFDRELRVALLLDPGAAARLRERARPFGGACGSLARLHDAVLAYRLGPELGGVVTPMLVTARHGERGWPGQSEALVDRLPRSRELVHTPHDPAVREARIFDWLDARLAAPRVRAPAAR